ncbi:short-chain dehydrogenase [Bacillus sp. JCM 19041]|uniref:short-chain dehydrogenase n=1 Tax=Bacillus sp. JCM 19041 TaxID=1460637 RepID=UPI000B173FCE
MNHVLVFGGTGMLAEAVSWLGGQSENLVVYARNEKKAESIRQPFTFYELDYTNTENVRTAIKKALAENGKVDLVLAWIHGTAPNAVQTIMDEVNQFQAKKWRLVHVKGSSSSKEAIEKKAKVDGSCVYQEVFLGFVVEESRSRWLTNEEISRGTIEAITRNTSRYLIGTLTPWDARP